MPLLVLNWTVREIGAVRLATYEAALNMSGINPELEHALRRLDEEPVRDRRQGREREGQLEGASLHALSPVILRRETLSRPTSQPPSTGR